jgi:hypothetical protein
VAVAHKLMLVFPAAAAAVTAGGVAVGDSRTGAGTGPGIEEQEWACPDAQ